jgi:tripartite-type tricarboxylate transporter receptor subunit TctC
VHVPYKGGGPAMADLMASMVDIYFGGLSTALPHVKSGKLRALGVTGPEASPLLPGVKPLVEQGFPGLLVFNSYPVMAPAGTPDAIVDKVRAGLKQAMSDPALRERLSNAAIDPVWTEPAELMKALAEDRKRWSELAKRANIQSPS